MDRGKLTVRRLTSWALTAGLSLRDAARRTPGEIVDLYVYRRQYDDEQHRIIREKRQCYD